MATERVAAKRWETCPHCNNRMQRVPIVYGYPAGDTEEAGRRGEIVLGGCVIRGNEPEWACPICRRALDGGGLELRDEFVE